MAEIPFSGRCELGEVKLAPGSQSRGGGDRPASARGEGAVVAAAGWGDRRLPSRLMASVAGGSALQQRGNASLPARRPLHHHHYHHHPRLPLPRAPSFSRGSSPSSSFPHVPGCAPSPAMPAASGTPSSARLVPWRALGGRVSNWRCRSSSTQEFFEPDHVEGNGFVPAQEVTRTGINVLRILKGANSFIPHIVLGSTILALAYPPSFTWFTTRYYAPALGFLMFAVGVNSSPKDFVEAISRPGAIFTGYVGQFVIKPLLGYLFGTLSVTVFQLPTSIGAGIMLVSCVSGAQLSNYATFLTDPLMAPLSIVMTSLSTATAVFVTPALSLLLIGKKLPVDVRGMMSSITQIVVVPIATGLLLNRFLPRVCAAVQPFLPPLSVLVTALCVGSPLAINVEAIVSPFGITILLLILGFHASAFIAGYFLPSVVFSKAPDMKALQRTISFETGMQSSLLALALANRFFQDPLVGVPPAISVVLMSLMGFSLVMLWSRKKNEQ